MFYEPKTAKIREFQRFQRTVNFSKICQKNIVTAIHSLPNSKSKTDGPREVSLRFSCLIFTQKLCCCKL